MDPEQARYRELFQTLEREANEARAARRPGKVSGGIVSASCAAVLAVYVTGYARTQTAADRFSKELSVRRAAALPLPGVSVSLNRGDVSHPTVDLDSKPKSAPEGSAAKPLRVKRTSVKPVEPKPEAHVEPTAEAAPAPVPESITPAAPAPAPAAVPATVWKDGTYTGWGYSRHGNIEAQVIIEGGRIASAAISQCRTRYSCSVIDRLPPQVAQRQSPEVDYVSGATQSADAFYGAVVEALAKAK
jgi:uncharacterized protein with FMN-binding domain